MATQSLKTRFLFTLHLLAVFATWLIPFLVNWKIALLVYAAVMIQFAIFGKCLMNEHHGTAEVDDRIFYHEFLEPLGFRFSGGGLKFFVRRLLYPALALFTLVWQLFLGHEPLIF
ncbi:MAG: hypothetical protein R3A50_04085 [Saprospiraceae bacterium]